MNRLLSWAEICATPEFEHRIRAFNIAVGAATQEFERSAPVMAAATLNGGTLICISCGAKTNARGVLPCGH